MFVYPVTLTPDGDTVLVSFADVPEAITFGADEDEALMQAVDALETALSFYLEARKHKPLPLPSKPKRGQRTVRPSALEGAKLGVYRAMTEQGIKKAELARRLGCASHLLQRANRSAK
jgi:antitoxin HicB